MVRFESGIAAMAGRRVTLPMGWLDYRVSATGQPVLKLDLTLPDQTRCSVSLCGRGFPTVAASLHNHTRKRPAGLITGVVTGDGEDTRFKTSITTTCVGAVGYRRLVFRGFDQRTGSIGGVGVFDALSPGCARPAVLQVCSLRRRRVRSVPWQQDAMLSENVSPKPELNLFLCGKGEVLASEVVICWAPAAAKLMSMY